MKEKAISQLNELIFFDPDWYRNANPDIGWHSPIDHVIKYGAQERRQLFNHNDIARLLSNTPLSVPTVVNFREPLKHIDIYVSSCGNVFMDQIADEILKTFIESGVSAARKTDKEKNINDPSLKIVVAPHEFFLLGNGSSFYNDEFMKRCIVYNTEQLQTPWLASTLPHLLSSAGIIDINNQSASLFRQSGLPSIHWEPTPKQRKIAWSESVLQHPICKSISNKQAPAEWADRPVDLSFFGAQSPRREKVFGRLAARIHSLNSLIYYRKQARPLSKGDDRALADVASFVSSRSKIYLNIHRDVMPYFEWHRIISQGVQNGAVVITDHCLPHPLYKPGTHFIAADARHIPDAIDWALNDPSGIRCCQAILMNNQNLLSSTQHYEQNANILFKFIQEVAEC